MTDMTQRSERPEDVVGVLGMGAMGQSFALRLLDLHHPVRAFVHRNASWRPEFESRGGVVLPGLTPLLAECDALLVCLPSVTEIERFLLPALQTGQRTRAVINLSTIGAEQARRVANQVYASGGQYVDAPVSGGPAAARSGSVSLAVSGRERDVAATRRLLDDLGSRTFTFGEVGNGQSAKLLNNAVNAIITQATGELLLAGAARGLDGRQLREYMLASSGASAPLKNVLGHTVLNDEFDKPLFKLGLMLKDLDLVNELLEADLDDLVLLNEAYSGYRAMAERGYGDHDFSIAALARSRGSGTKKEQD